MQGVSKSIFNINRISTNVLILIIFSILLVFVGALTSILLFTYTATINLVQTNQEEILVNKELNHQIIENTREIPLQNKEMLTDLSRIVNFLGANFNQTFIDGIYEERRTMNQTLKELLDNQALLIEHINATTDIFGTASHETTPGLRNALYAIAASSPTSPTHKSFTDELDTLLQDLNRSGTVIKNLQEQVKNLSIQVPNASDTVQQEFGTAFPFAENRVHQTETPENESMLKEPEGGRIAGLP